MALTLMTALMVITAVQEKSILRTNYGYFLETLKAQVYFSIDDSRIVLYYTLPK